MSTLGIELVDAALVAVRDGVRVASSPGVALADAGGLLVGERAAAAARERPVLATDRFWSDLSVEAFAPNADPPRSHADLAHAHMAGLWSAIAAAGDEAVLALPGAMRLHQVGLAVAIARRAGVPVAGVVDSAVAACAGLAARQAVLHLDVHLHQAVLTELRGRARLRRGRIEIAPRAGLKAMHAAWAQLVSEGMVRRTRFDPLHQAVTEQQLHDRLPGWLEALVGAGSVDAGIEAGGRTYTVTVSREQFALAAEAWYAQIEELAASGRRAGEAVTLALSARAASLPGLPDRLSAVPGVELLTLPETAPAAAAAERAAEIGPAEPLVLVTALDRRLPIGRAIARGARPVAMRPTHVILDGRAHAIDERPLVLGTGTGPGRHVTLTGRTAGVSRSHCTLVRERGQALLRDQSRYGTFVNGERVDGEVALAAGDRIRVGTPGIEFVLVTVS